MLRRVTRMGATWSLLLALAAGLGLVVWPCATRGGGGGGGGAERQLCASLIQANGVRVLDVLPGRILF
jgi:hypothetical protein